MGNETKQRGFAVMSVLLVVLLLAVVGFAGWMVYQNQQDKTAAPATTQTSVETQKPIEKAADVDGATKELDAVNVDKGLDTSELDKDVESVL